MTAEGIDLRDKCVVCGHSFSFHGKRLDTECRAMGCKGDNGQRCQFFEPAPTSPADLGAIAQPVQA